MTNQRIATAIAIGVILLVVFGGTLSAQPRRVARIAAPAEGEIVQGPNVTFTVESSGFKVPEEGHYHLFIDQAALRYVLGNPIPLGQVDFVHFRTPTTTVKLDGGPHIAVLVPGDPQHVPFRPIISDSRYFFVK